MGYTAHSCLHLGTYPAFQFLHQIYSTHSPNHWWAESLVTFYFFAMGSLTFWQPLLPALGSWSEELIVQRWTTQLHQTICPNLEYITKQTEIISRKGKRHMLCCLKTEQELQCCHKSLYNRPLFHSEEKKPSLGSRRLRQIASAQPYPVLLLHKHTNSAR